LSFITSISFRFEWVANQLLARKSGERLNINVYLPHVKNLVENSVKRASNFETEKGPCIFHSTDRVSQGDTPESSGISRIVLVLVGRMLDRQVLKSVSDLFIFGIVSCQALVRRVLQNSPFKVSVRRVHCLPPFPAL
jgi:hypothetical protein